MIHCNCKALLNPNRSTAPPLVTLSFDSIFFDDDDRDVLVGIEEPDVLCATPLLGSCVTVT